MRPNNRFPFFLFLSLLSVLSVPRPVGAQIFISTGTSSGLRLYAPGAPDWWLNPLTGQLNLIVGGNSAAPVVSFTSSGGVGVGTASPNLIDGVNNNGTILGVVNTAGGIARLSAEGGNGAVLNLVHDAAAANQRWFQIVTQGGTTTLAPTNDASNFVANSIVIQHSSGNVGIGTTSPAAALDVNGTGILRSTAAIFQAADAPLSTTPPPAVSVLHLFRSGQTTLGSANQLLIGSANTLNSYAQIGFGWTNSPLTYAPGVIGFQATNVTGSVYGDLVLGTRNATTDTAPSERLRITSSGNVGVSSASPQGLFVVGNGTLTVTSGGSVGIGTASPDAGFQLVMFNGSSLVRNNSGSRPVYGIRYDNLAVAYFLGVQNDGRFNISSYLPTDNFDNNTGAGINMTSSGNVGVGTTAPVEALQVNGHVDMQGTGPTVTNCGAGAAATGSDGVGFVCTGTGSPTTCAMTFSRAFTNRPICLFQPTNIAFQATASAIDVRSATATFSAAYSSGCFNYLCLGN